MNNVFYFIIGWFIGNLIDRVIFKKGVTARIIDLIDSYYSYKKAERKLKTEKNNL